MIQPAPAQSNGIIGQQHGLQRLTGTLDALQEGQRQQQTRDEQLRKQLTAQAEELAHLRTWGHRLVWALIGLAGLTLGLGGLAGWQVTHPPDQRYGRALAAIDTTIATTWSTMPKPVQEQLSATYGRIGLVPPGKR